MAKTSSSGAEYIIHCTGVRLRVVGSGNLDLSLLSLDSIRSYNLLPLALSSSNDRELTRLANFKSQRMQLSISVDVINETFKISKIILFTKVSGTSYPG